VDGGDSALERDWAMACLAAQPSLLEPVDPAILGFTVLCITALILVIVTAVQLTIHRSEAVAMGTMFAVAPAARAEYALPRASPRFPALPIALATANPRS
jgi:hypothetical protein